MCKERTINHVASFAQTRFTPLPLPGSAFHAESPPPALAPHTEPPYASENPQCTDALSPWHDANLDMGGRLTKRHDGSDSAGPPCRPCEAKDGVEFWKITPRQADVGVPGRA